MLPHYRPCVGARNRVKRLSIALLCACSASRVVTRDTHSEAVKVEAKLQSTTTATEAAHSTGHVRRTVTRKPSGEVFDVTDWISDVSSEATMKTEAKTEVAAAAQSKGDTQVTKSAWWLPFAKWAAIALGVVGLAFYLWRRLTSP